MIRWKTIAFSQIKFRKTNWLLKPFIARGVIATLTGDGGVGKSTCVIDLIGRITTGYPMPQIGEQPPNDPPLKGSAVICKEDDPARVIKARLAAAGADMSKVHIVVVRRSRLPDDYEVIDGLDTGADQLEAACRSGNVALVAAWSRICYPEGERKSSILQMPL